MSVCILMYTYQCVHRRVNSDENDIYAIASM